jgi:hypothetical protein
VPVTSNLQKKKNFFSGKNFRTYGYEKKNGAAGGIYFQTAAKLLPFGGSRQVKYLKTNLTATAGGRDGIGPNICIFLYEIISPG